MLKTGSRDPLVALRIATKSSILKTSGAFNEYVAELPSSTIADAARLIGTRALSCVELTELMLRRIDTFDPQLCAFITVTLQRALEETARADMDISAVTVRPLHGIPIGLEDVYS